MCIPFYQCENHPGTEAIIELLYTCTHVCRIKNVWKTVWNVHKLFIFLGEVLICVLKMFISVIKRITSLNYLWAGPLYQNKIQYYRHVNPGCTNYSSDAVNYFYDITCFNRYGWVFLNLHTDLFELTPLMKYLSFWGFGNKFPQKYSTIH